VISVGLMVRAKPFSGFHGSCCWARRNLVVTANSSGCLAGYFRRSSHRAHTVGGQPPSLIETKSPIDVTKLLAAPHVKAVRAQTMLVDSYVS